MTVVQGFGGDIVKVRSSLPCSCTADAHGGLQFAGDAVLVVWTLSDDNDENPSTMQEAVLLASKCALQLQEVSQADNLRHFVIP